MEDKYVTLKQVLQNEFFKEFIGKLSEGVVGIYLFGGLRKRRRTTKDVDLLIVTKKTQFRNFIHEKIDGFEHLRNIHEEYDVQQLKFYDRKRGFTFLAIDLWQTDVQHFKLACKSLGIRKPLSILELLQEGC